MAPGLPQMRRLIDPEARSMACPGGRGGDASREIAGLAPGVGCGEPALSVRSPALARRSAIRPLYRSLSAFDGAPFWRTPGRNS